MNQGHLPVSLLLVFNDGRVTVLGKETNSRNYSYSFSYLIEQYLFFPPSSDFYCMIWCLLLATISIQYIHSGYYYETYIFFLFFYYCIPGRETSSVTGKHYPHFTKLSWVLGRDPPSSLSPLHSLPQTTGQKTEHMGCWLHTLGAVSRATLDER